MKIVYTRQFKRDFKRAKKQDKDLDTLKSVIDALCSKQRLAPSYQDHPLILNWAGFRECHIAPDWLLIYKITTEELLLVRMGSHSELFE